MINDTWSRRDLLRRGAVAGGLVVAPGLLVACQRTQPGTGQAAQSVLERAKQEGTIRVGFANEAPYAFRNEDGELVGEAPAVHREIFSNLGIPELDPQVTDFNGLIPGLTANRWDVVTAGMFILPDRCGQVAFSEPEYCGDSAFLVREGNPENITSYEDIAEKDVVLGVFGTAAVESSYAENAGVDSSKLKSYERQQDGLEALVAGRIDAFALTSPSLKYMAETNPDAPVEVTEPFIPTIDGEEQIDCGGAAFRQGDTELLEAFNAELAKLKESGRLLELIREWGFSETNLPRDDITTEQLCSR